MLVILIDMSDRFARSTALSSPSWYDRVDARDNEGVGKSKGCPNVSRFPVMRRAPCGVSTNADSSVEGPRAEDAVEPDALRLRDQDGTDDVATGGSATDCD
jgi:hypothetical protein